MEDKPKRRRSDSDLDPRFVSPPQTASQTAPANPFSAQTAGPSSNPFERASRTLRTSVRAGKSRQTLSSRQSVPENCKLKADGFDPQDLILAQKIRQQEGCTVRVYRDKGWAMLYFDSQQKASECLERGIHVEGHPNLRLYPCQRAGKKSVLERLDKPLAPSERAPTLPEPRISVHPREEQLFLLEQRDSQLRDQLRTGEEALRGVCEDMCPEKERFWREDRRCLSVFELLPGGEYKIDHTAAVKEFSRSAADKSQPLAHELRTEGALERTVLYLCHRVLPHETRSKEWYSFLSNRLEAVRQDITVQHLCSLRTAGLLEACARFHVLCAFLLLSAPFEQHEREMNDMSLRSILTPLLQMYRDLRLQGPACPGEPLFVSFSLTIAIQTELIAQDLLLVTDDVIASPEVQRVIRLWRAVATEDFVGFFSLLRGADFLLAVLMNRFVPRMRLQALRLLNRHTGKQGDTMDTERIARLLCFDDVSECVQICTQLAMQCDKATLYLSPARPVQSSVRSLPLRLIGQKNALELAAVVLGAQSPPFQPRPPTFSRCEEAAPSWEAALQALAECEAAEWLESELLSGLEAVAREALREGQRQQLIGQLGEELGHRLMGEGVLGLVKVEAERELGEQREEQRRRRGRRLFIEQLSAELFERLLHQLIGQLAAGELAGGRELAALRSRVVEELSLAAYSALESEAVGALLRAEGEGGLREAKARRKERLEEQRGRVRTLRLRNLWGLWRDAREMRQRQREAVKKFPRVAPHWVPPQQWRLGSRAPGSLVTAEERERVSGWLRCERTEAERQRNKLLTPIDIPALLGNSLLERCINDWLLVVLVAGTDIWPLEALTSESTADSTSHVCALADSAGGTRGRTRVRLVLGGSPAGELKGCSGVLLIAGSCDESETRERLDLLTGVKARPQLPLCLMHTLQAPRLGSLPACVGELRVSHVGPELSPAGKRELEQSLQWLAAHSSPPPRLLCLSLREYVSDRMYALFCQETARHGAERERVGVRGCPLGPTYALFSAGLECVREELTGRTVGEVNWPINDHDLWEWNEAGQFEAISFCLEQLTLQLQPEPEPEPRLDRFLDRCRLSVPSYPAYSAECESLTRSHSSRLKRLGLPHSPPWAQLLEALLHARMQHPRFDSLVCYEADNRAQLRPPSEWTASLTEVTRWTARLPPGLLRRLNSQSEARTEALKRRRSSDLRPISGLSEEPARKTARLKLEESILRLEGLLAEEASQARHLSALLQTEGPGPGWEEQLASLEREIKSLTEYS